MHSLPLLLLCFCLSSTARSESANIGGTDKYHIDVSAGILKLLDPKKDTNGQENDLVFIDDYMRHKKRAHVPFVNAWNAVLKSTLGFTVLKVDGKDTKLFVKVGSIADATKDFYSFGPTTVSILPSGLLLGVVENHVIGLRVKKAPRRPVLYVLNGNGAGDFLRVSRLTNVKKIIRYYNNGIEAKSALGRWRRFSSVQ